MRTYAEELEEESTTAGEDSCPASDDDTSSICSDDAGLEYTDHPEDIYDAYITHKFNLPRADGTTSGYHAGSALAAAQVQRSISVPVSLSDDTTAGTPHSYMPCMGAGDAAAGETMSPSAASQESRAWEAMPPSGSSQRSLSGGDATL